ncbi:MAG: aminotransferase class I/II-fold pyridoxal phosphate-dependent enzyme, partial [Gemmatimonadota bacterium]
MSTFAPFTMERWQSTYENRVDYNLSESGVHPLTLGELVALAAGDRDAAGIDDTPIGYGQSNGSDMLRARIAALYANSSGATVSDNDDIVVCNGSAEANFLAMTELVRPGDEVAILVPTYMQTYGLTQNLGARVSEIPLREELGWQPDPDQIRSAVTDATRVIVVTNPGNPSGAVLNEDVRRAIVEAAERTGAWILADEVYTGAELDGRATPSFHGLHERVVATGSLSKAYGLPGLRIGWAHTDPRTAAAIWARSDYTTISTGELTDRLACVALNAAVRPKLLARTRGIIAEGLGILTTWMREHGGFHWHDPAAGAICFARYDADIPSDVLAERLRTEQSVLIVPGSHFGLGRYIRFGTGAPHLLGAAL